MNRYLDWLKKVFGIIIALLIVVIGVGKFTDAIDNISKFISSLSNSEKLDLEIFYDGKAVNGKTITISEYGRFIIPLHAIEIENKGKNLAKGLSIKIHFSRELKKYGEMWPTGASELIHGWSINNSFLEGYVSLLEFKEKIDLHPNEPWSRPYKMVLNFDRPAMEVRSVSSKLLVYGADEPMEVDLILQPSREKIVKATTVITSISPEIPAAYNVPLGLTWDGTHLWTSITPVGSKAPVGRLYRIRIDDGSIVSWIDFPGQSPHGIAWDGNYLWGVDVGSKTLYKINPQDGSTISSFPAPSTGDNPNPHGLCYDGHFLWLADSNTNTIYKINPQTGAVVFSSPAPNVVWGLAWDGEYLWSSDPKSQLIYSMDPKDGKIISTRHSPGPYPVGLTWQDSYLWNADYKTKRIYKLE